MKNAALLDIETRLADLEKMRGALEVHSVQSTFGLLQDMLASCHNT